MLQREREEQGGSGRGSERGEMKRGKVERQTRGEVYKELKKGRGGERQTHEGKGREKRNTGTEE